MINIRPATFDDVPELMNLISLSVWGLSTGHYTNEQIESAIKYVFGIDSQLISDGTYYVAENDNIKVGCGGWSKRNTLFGGDQHKDVEDPLLDPTKDAARIRAFFVHPDFARQGIGRKLINVCEDAARANEFKSFELAATLPGALLYEAMGYTAIERIEVVLPDKEVLRIVKMSKTCVKV